MRIERRRLLVEADDERAPVCAAAVDTMPSMASARTSDRIERRLSPAGAVRRRPILRRAAALRQALVGLSCGPLVARRCVIHVTICGAGAIGGFTGASLARAGHDVLLVDAAEAHVAAINAHGLTIERPGAPDELQVPAVTPDKLTGPRDLVLLSVKSQHTAAALDAVVPCLSPTGTIVALQNGLNEELISSRIGAARTVGCLVNFGADWQAPGRIQWGGPGAIVLGELDGRVTPRVKDLAQLLAAAGETQITQNIWGVKWSKHVYGALLFATALVDATVHEVVARSLRRFSRC